MVRHSAVNRAGEIRRWVRYPPHQLCLLKEAIMSKDFENDKEYAKAFGFY